MFDLIDGARLGGIYYKIPTNISVGKVRQVSIFKQLGIIVGFRKIGEPEECQPQRAVMDLVYHFGTCTNKKIHRLIVTH